MLLFGRLNLRGTEARPSSYLELARHAASAHEYLCLQPGYHSQQVGFWGISQGGERAG